MTKLAIVDGHEALRDGLADLLGRRGLDVVGVAGNAAAGMDLVAVADPDVALVELRLPDGDGITLARALLRVRPDLGVVLYTGEPDPELLEAGLACGVRGHALKAGSTEELLGAIELVAAGGTYVDPRLEASVREARAAVHEPQLSPREREIMHHMAEGLTAEGIGAELDVSIETVRTHVRNVIRKLEARNRVHAVALALEGGEITLDRRG